MSDDAVYCEVCELPHRSHVPQCERCQHELGTPADPLALRIRMRGHRDRMWIGILFAIGMIVLNVWAFRGAGMIMFIAPLGWTVWESTRYRAIATNVERIERKLGMR